MMTFPLKTETLLLWCNRILVGSNILKIKNHDCVTFINFPEKQIKCQ